MYIKNLNAITSKEIIFKITKELGIPDDIIVFSDCHNNRKNGIEKCDCEEWKRDKEDILIYFGTTPVKDISPLKFRFGFRIMTKKEFNNHVGIMCGDHYGYNLDKFFIVINVGCCYEDEVPLSMVLKHELLHCINSKHCTNEDCFFSESKSATSFCKKCEEDFKNVISKIKGTKN